MAATNRRVITPRDLRASPRCDLPSRSTRIFPRPTPSFSRDLLASPRSPHPDTAASVDAHLARSHHWAVRFSLSLSLSLAEQKMQLRQQTLADIEHAQSMVDKERQRRERLEVALKAEVRWQTATIHCHPLWHTATILPPLMAHCNYTATPYGILQLYCHPLSGPPLLLHLSPASLPPDVCPGLRVY